ncbi:Eukaryotic initiation factor 4B protein [Operophtera brumata]|uniref:Eukaryotic initiation factor 4B protein n=1 Tax=Operophtera brumata TaxID=104452 RepID=A0A0L7KW75_OPEBR|nr:Eukaryotic initiation factor 4B protein [Operophtera brumata]
MAATGKKGKKAKWVKANLTDILAEPTTIPATNWAADTVEETEGYSYGNRTRAPVVLPSVSRAARGGLAVDDESIPRRPPYIAHISNLPYDVDESAIAELFEGLKITNLRLPREGDRLKGFGYVDFEDRESLVSAMNIADLDNDRRMGRTGMGRSDRDREYDPERTTGDWRSGPRAAPDPSASRPRGMERERDPDRGEMTRAGMREREPDSSAADNKPGGWRDGERAAPEPARTPYGGRDSWKSVVKACFCFSGGRERGYGGRDGFRTAERPERDGDSRPRERPKLNLLPRTVPREAEVPTKPADGAGAEPEKAPEKPKPVSAEKVFGAAKPDDKDRRNDRDRRDYSRDDRDRRDDRDYRDRRDYSGERRRQSRDGSRDGGRSRDRRDGSRDRRDGSRDRRDGSRDRREGSRDRREGSRDRREGSRERREGSRDRRGSHENREGSRDRKEDSRGGSRRRESSRERRDYSRDRPDSRDRQPTATDNKQVERNGGARPSRERDRRDDADDKPLPQMKEQEKPNFVASNKFSFLEDADDAVSD